MVAQCFVCVVLLLLCIHFVIRVNLALYLLPTLQTSDILWCLFTRYLCICASVHLNGLCLFMLSQNSLLLVVVVPFVRLKV